MKAKNTNKADVAPAKYVGCNIDGHHSYRADVAPASGQHISLDLQTVIQDQINQGTYKESVFAAAPELLEALKCLLSADEMPSTQTQAKMALAAMEQARAAIAKAEGKQ